MTDQTDRARFMTALARAVEKVMADHVLEGSGRSLDDGHREIEREMEGAAWRLLALDSTHAEEIWLKAERHRLRRKSVGAT